MTVAVYGPPAVAPTGTVRITVELREPLSVRLAVLSQFDGKVIVPGAAMVAATVPLVVA